MTKRKKLVEVGDYVKRKKDGKIMRVTKDEEATLYVDNDRIGVTDANFYLEHGAIEKVNNEQIEKVVKYIKYIIENVEMLNNALDDALRVKEVEQQNKRYREAIRECIECMDKGGAGTRSFVYEKLIEVLEGEK